MIRDAENNTVSLIALIEELNVPGVPGMLANLNALFTLERDAGDPEQHNLAFRVAQEGQPPNEFPVTADFQGKLRTRLIVRIGGVPIHGPGVVTVGIAVPGAVDLLGAWHIPVTITGPPIVQAVN